MICKKKKNKSIYVFLLSLILVCGLLQSSVLSCNTYASSSSTTVGDYLNNNNFYDVCAYFCRGFASFPDPYGGGTGFTVEAFADYLEEKGKSSILQEPVTITEPSEGASGGRGYDLPQEARQEIINFVQSTVIESEPLSYVQATIPSYKKLGTAYFSNYATYQTILQWMENKSKQRGYMFLISVENTSSYGYPIQIIAFPTDLEWNLYGNVDSNGIFGTVNLGVNWQGNPTLGVVNSTPTITPYFPNIDFGYMRSDNGATVNGRWVGNITGSPLKNVTGLGVGNSYKIILSSSPTDETVYVFNNMNAYKAYNSGNPQPYYLLSNPNYVAPSYDPVTDSQLQSAGNFYNNIVNNLSAGQTPEQVQTVVKETLQGKSNNGSNNDDSFNLGFLGTIGKVITAVTGAFTPVQDLVDNQVTEFVTDVFGWLPAEIVILWISGIIFAVLFGVLKIIRG